MQVFSEHSHRCSYKAEVYKSLSGEGRFDAELLNELIAACKSDIEQLTTRQTTLKAELAEAMRYAPVQTGDKVSADAANGFLRDAVLHFDGA